MKNRTNRTIESTESTKSKRTKRTTKSIHFRVNTESTNTSSFPKICRGTGAKRAVLTKVSEERYNQLKELQERLGYESIYSLVEGIISLQLRCIRDYPEFHGGKELEKFEDLEDMLEMYLIHRVPIELS